MKYALPLALLLLASACSPPPTAKEMALRADFADCLSEAKESVPDYLYPTAHYEQETLPDDRGILRTHNVLVEPDYAVTEPLDKERMGLITPCMREKGWRNQQTQAEWDRVRLLTH